MGADFPVWVLPAPLFETYARQGGAARGWREPFDLVICQGVLAYLSPADLKRALRYLGTLTRGALYLEVVTREDYENDIVDDTLTDPRLFRHRAEAYRRGLAPNFRHAGGGVWLSRDCEVPLYAMECADDA